MKKQIVLIVQADTEKELWEGIKQLASENDHPDNMIGTCGEKANVDFDYYTEDTDMKPTIAALYHDVQNNPEWKDI